LGFRTNFSANEKDLTNLIDANFDNRKDPKIEQIIKLGQSITSKQLNFTISNNDIDPNKLLTSKTAHCVGYATFFATTCNYLLLKYGLNNKWTAKPRIGQLYFLGTNIHKYFNTSFFKDHDFVTVENNETGEIIAVDPTINDYLYIDFITYTE
jgi:hypothetical protein